MSLFLPRVFNLTRGRASPDFVGFYNTLGRKQGSLLGLDIGTRQVGVAVSDEGRKVAFKSFCYRRGTVEEDRRVLHTQLEGMNALGVVIGMPIARAEDEIGDLPKFITAYSALLLNGLDCPACAFWDESYTSVHANMKIQEAAKKAARRNARKRKQMVDEGAAAEILQETLDALLFHSEQMNHQEL